ncbi:5-histidylcysteine sulfoxide synthase [Arcobacter aquimarinus]|uniref:5-histidylcysteine sulfoxide synthase / 4-mercaptohistidine N1-methyltransferase OvoA n=1 Tax=Arcobacter aquimarinus TaxID=1315211 RepID=A0AAE7B5U9_9BACT|nr:5-histidylcysteine sulfoxide synthase [Arcobacter aquimarinus]QKE26210.1 putative 5-histidylcysteine sulfoxide synthase / 4-mercaptohistidine N1-methyltransferase OvoA [Arcobacter aquimarinus]RXI35791.1 methyltransferase [Arcobacter aquimarinus]
MNYIKNSVNLNTGSIEEKREEIKKQFLQTYELDEKLFDLLKEKDFIYEQPNRLRHPLIFYYGHTATFFINKLILANIIKQRVNPEFESIFAIGVDEMSWDDLNSGNYKWPKFEEIKDYRQKVKNIILKLIDNIEFTIPINWDSSMWIILMGIEHENIHIETSSVLLRELDIKYLKKDEIFTYSNESSNDYPINELIDVKGGAVILQKDRKNPIFYGWDNEFSYHASKIDDFKASKYLVSNGEFLEFVKEDGYNKPEFFSKEGREWLGYTNAKHPTFWIKEDENYFLREINRVVSLPLNYPVDVNLYEAEAFCKYKSQKLGIEVRLPSEDEYYRLYDFVDAGNKEANIGLIQFNQSPVNKYKFDEFYDVVGNVWQWTLTPIYPFDDFVPHPIYDDFTTPTYDDRHALIKGGSFISLGNETLKESRYAFRKHFFQHAGFRYVNSSNEYRTKLNDNVYETDELISQYCEFHYGNENFGVKNFCVNSVELLNPYIKNIKTSKALDLGCSVGRASFELAKTFDEVLGIDFSANFINVGVKLKNYDSLIYKIKKEGELFEEKSVSLKDLGLEQIKNKVSFMQGDACNLKDIYSGFDLVFCSNLIDRLYYPQKFLDDIPSRINKDGLLVLLSPYTWLEDYTPKENWLGGYIKDNKEISTLDSLKNNLSSQFELLDIIDVPFVIKETARKYQHTISQMTIWKKKD